MKFGFSTNAFRSYDLDETIEILGDAGYNGVEILLDEPHLYPSSATVNDIEHIDDLLANLGLVVSNCNAFMLSAIERNEKSHTATYDRETEEFHHPSFIELDENDRQKRIEHTKNALKTAADLGAPHISIQPGGPVPNEKSDEQAMNEFVDGVRQVVPTAEEVGVDVLIEPEPDLLIETSTDYMAFADRIDSPRVGCNFDAGHFFCVDEDPAELVEPLASHTGHYHLEDIPADRTHEHTQLGDGGMDIDGFLQAVDDSSYDGFVTVELYPYGETAEKTARDAFDYLEEHGWV